MNIQELVNNCAHVSFTLTGIDLKDFGEYLIDKTRRELEEIVLTDKAETFPTVKQVSEILQVTIVTLWRWNQKGYLKTIEFGGGRRYKMSEVKAILNGGR